jgi:ADP-heptose:LPS heptosyltransferase
MTRFLALIPGGISDQLLCFPMLESLQQQYPQAQIDVVVEPQAKAAYRISPVAKQVLTYNFQGRNGPADWGNLVGWVREREYDGLISLDRGLFRGLLLWLMGIPKRVGYAKVPNALFMTDTATLKPKQYAAQMYHDLLDGMHIHTPCPPLSIHIPLKDREWTEAEQEKLGLDLTQGYAIIHGGSLAEHQEKGAANIYPKSSWQALVKGFQQRQPDLSVVLVQSPSDRAWFKSLLEVCPGLKVSTPQDLGKFAALIAGAKLMVSTDSDAMHIAVAAGTQLFALFGPSDPDRVLPKDERFTALRSSTGKVSDIAPIQVLEKIWGK